MFTYPNNARCMLPINVLSTNNIKIKAIETSQVSSDFQEYEHIVYFEATILEVSSNSYRYVLTSSDTCRSLAIEIFTVSVNNNHKIP